MEATDFSRHRNETEKEARYDEIRLVNPPAEEPVTQEHEKATRIELFSLRTVQMRTFHLSWLAFFICFFGWFAHAPLMPATIGPDLGLTKDQILLAFMTSVGITIFARLGIGHLCDRIGPRMTYVSLLVFGAVAVAGSAFVQTWPMYLFSRMCIGVIGAAFVITQYHTSVMFASNTVGLANATTAGWGNLGGGVTQAVMPMIAGATLALGFAESPLEKWRYAMFVPATAMLGVAYLYWRFTTDCPKGNYADLPEDRPQARNGEPGLFISAVRDYRVWLLFSIYAGCFGMELFVNGNAAGYYQDRFMLDESTAGIIASLFGLMNIFARTTGGWLGDRFAARTGLIGRVRWLVMIMVAEGVALVLFSRMGVLPVAIVTMVLFSLCVQMAEGATYSVVPFVNRRSLGAVSGIVGAGGNVGAVCYAQLIRHTQVPLQDGFLYFGLAVACLGMLGFGIRFSPAMESMAHEEYQAAELQGAGARSA